ncbi:MAG: hypothetical protein Q8Q23_05410 [bacterium]|nr:hypothetical protein [bacterium]
MTTMALALQNAFVAKTGAKNFASLGGDVATAINDGVRKAANNNNKRVAYVTRLKNIASGSGNRAEEATFKLWKMGAI